MDTKVHRNKILFIITDLGSFNNFLSELSIDLILNHGFEVSVICSEEKVINYENKSDFKLFGIRFHFIDIPRSYNIKKQLQSSKKINSIILTEKPDIIHAHFTTAIFTTLLLKKTKTKIWGTFHGLGYPVSKGINKIIFKVVEYYCFLRLEKIIVLNNLDLISVPIRYKGKLIKTRCVGLGCDLKKFNRDKFSISEKTRLKDSLNISTQFVLAFTGRFVHFKGFDILARVFIELSEKNKNSFKLILIGGRDIVHATGLSIKEEKVFFSHPDVLEVGFTKDVDQYLSSVDLFVFPSKKEGVPISITESLAMGIPVITFNSRGCNDLVKNLYNGILIDENPNQLVEISLIIKAIEKLSTEKGLYHALTTNAINSRDTLSRDNFINEQTEWYLET
jgi:glycosyltransferase involved in cell wall biosynthesis